MRLASHNSWSYASPKYWYMYPFRFMARCQKQSIPYQWNAGVRMFDLRLFFDKKGNLLVRHGIMSFSISIEKLLADLDYLNRKTSEGPVYVRVLLEQNHKVKSQEFQELKFKEFCELLDNSFNKIYFLEGRRKYDWKQLYNFHYITPPIIHCYSSTTSMFGSDKNKWYAKLDDFWPWLYAQIHNADNYAKYLNSDNFIMFDFI